MMDKRMEGKVKKYLENFLKKWDGKCLICGKPVAKSHLFKDGMPDMINGAVIGEYIEVYGHPVCVKNVDRIVVMPNRGRMILATKKEEKATPGLFVVKGRRDPDRFMKGD